MKPKCSSGGNGLATARWVIGGFATLFLVLFALAIKHQSAEGHGVTLERTATTNRVVNEIKVRIETMQKCQTEHGLALSRIETILQQRSK